VQRQGNWRVVAALFDTIDMVAETFGGSCASDATARKDGSTVRVTKLPRIATKESIQKHFEEYGPVVSVEPFVDGDKKDAFCQGALIEFEDEYTAQMILESGEFNEFRGRKITVEVYQAEPQAPTVLDAEEAAHAQEAQDNDFYEGFDETPQVKAEKGGSRFSAAYRAATGLDKRREEALKQRKFMVAKHKKDMANAITNGKLEAALDSCEEIVNLGEPPSNDLMRSMLESAADLPGVERFARAVNVVARGGIRFDCHGFASLVGRLMAREAPHAQVRCALNFGLRKDADVLPLIPLDCDRESDVADTFTGAEHDDSGEIGVDEEAAPRGLYFHGCAGAPGINGMYRRLRPNQKLSGNNLHIYEKVDQKFNKKGKKMSMYAYYFVAAKGPQADPNWQTGWYIGTEVGGGGVTYAHCTTFSQSKDGPPLTANSWKLSISDGTWDPSPGQFVPANEGSAAVILESTDAQTMLGEIDLERLKGSLVGRDEETIRYFGHFFVLLTLEHLAEVRGFRGRWNFRSVTELVDFGLCFNQIEVEYTERANQQSRRMPLPGWPDEGSQKVHFVMPRGTHEERCRFKRAESVIISHGNPLRERVCEGSITNIDFMGRQMTVNVNGMFPVDSSLFRVDLYANRTSYERQVTALMQFVTMQRTRICDMLVAAGVGQVDLAVLGGDGFSSDKDALAKQIAGSDTKAARGGCDADEGAAEAAEDGAEGNDTKAAPGDEDKDEQTKKEAVTMSEDGAVEGWLTEDLIAEDIGEKPLIEDIAEDTGEHRELETPEEQEKREREERKKKTIKIADEEIPDMNYDQLEQAEEEIAVLPHVSSSQQEAIANSMHKRLTIVQGPPGTGKTHTSVRIMSMWVKTMGYRPLLCTSECNVAVDNIAEGLAKNGVNVVRVGRPEKVKEDMERVVLDNMVKNEVERLRKERAQDDDGNDELFEKREEPQDRESPEYLEWKEWRTKRNVAMTQQRKEQARIRMRFLEEADVIAATTVSSGSQALAGFKFHAILIDEVAQATECSTIVPIVCRGATQLVLCGDHCQLPPSVVSREAQLRGFSLSLYSRLVEAGVPFRFLDTQYRAHPMLMEFSAACIYQGKLKHGIEGSKRPQPKGIDWPDPECPAAFFACDVEEHLDGESKANEAEAKYILKMVKDCLKVGELLLSDIGIICPYKGQVRVIRKVFQPFVQELRAEWLKLDEATRGLDPKKELEVASVDNFQGREKELIIFSAVRCNNIASVGFLSDWRRLNVMITRARRGLVVVGNAATLACDPHWKL